MMFSKDFQKVKSIQEWGDDMPTFKSSKILARSFLFHERWPKIAPWISIEVYGRDGGVDGPRVRIELAGDAPKRIENMALKLTMPCVACGNIIRPFRTRRSKDVDSRSEHVGKIYFAAACDRKTNAGCGNGRAASLEYTRIKLALRPDLVEGNDTEMRLLMDFVGWMQSKRKVSRSG